MKLGTRLFSLKDKLEAKAREEEAAQKVAEAPIKKGRRSQPKKK